MIVPRPRSLTVCSGHFELTRQSSLYAPPATAALVRELLSPATGLPLPEAGGPGPDTLAFRLDDDCGLGPEGYRLTVTETGVDVVAATEVGLGWAVQTLRQLLPAEVYASDPQLGVAWRLPCVEIADEPRYRWRGALLDVARWCHPLPFLYRFVDLLAVHKLNTLHLHLTDDQGWRFEVHRYPLLTEVGGWRNESSAGHVSQGRFDHTRHGGFYTQDQLRDLVGYAARRGVRIMPEIDVPGHTQAAIAAYPRLGNEPSRRLPVRPEWGISTHVLNVEDATVSFVRDVLDELVDVFPFEYVHVGGDEVPGDEWRASEAAQRRAAELGLPNVAGLLGWWTRQLADHLRGYGRRVAVWDELLEHRPPHDATIFAWRGEQRVEAARSGGFDVVAVPYTHTYLDWAESDDADEPLAINGVLPLPKVYGYRPGDVLGVQGQLWSEYLPRTELVEWRAFPRLGAIAEVGWSEPGEYAEFERRATAHQERLDVLGVRYRPVKPTSAVDF
ncbi:MAG TPA: beta-N-acetylhexosaminidase [Micromonosporaceae bacterium]